MLLSPLPFSCTVTFMPGSVPRNSEHKDNFDLGHGVCQALTGTKLHKTKIKDTYRSHLSAHASKESDRECPKCRTL